MRPQGTPQQLEKRRLQAIRLLKEGQQASIVARWLGASKSSVSRWQQAYREQGKEGLRPKPIPGRPPRLSKVQKAKLVRWLLRSPLAYGYRTDLWTLKRVAHLIEERLHVRYHPNHVWRLLADLDWSCQKPVKRARERDEKAIAHWKRYVWPHIKKGRQSRCPPGIPR
jgi:transposase